MTSWTHSGRCPWCEGRVLRDDLNRRLAHSAPQCAGFSDMLRRAEPPSSSSVELVPVDPTKKGAAG